jgi:hypothetical protein
MMVKQICFFLFAILPFLSLADYHYYYYYYYYNYSFFAGKTLGNIIIMIGTTLSLCRYALETLKKSRIKRIHIVGRRGPAQVHHLFKSFDVSFV